MQDSLSIRSYTKSLKRHAHHYHQIVLPINGYIDIDMAPFCGKMRVGEAIVIHAGRNTVLKPMNNPALSSPTSPIYPITSSSRHLQSALGKPIMAFLTYVELQLQDVTSVATQEAATALLNNYWRNMCNCKP